MTEHADIAPGFILLQGNKLESLRQVTIDWIRAYPLAPLESETILVQSNGMAQWLRLGLAQPRADSGAGHGSGLGIATALNFILPARLQWQCYRALLGEAAVPAESPLDKGQLVWRLMRLLPTLWDQPAFRDLRHYILTDDKPDERRLYQLAQRIADQLDQYQVYRADWLLHWQSGRDDLPTGETPLEPGQHWQPILWRAIVDDARAQHIANDRAPDAALGRAELHLAFRTAAARCESPPETLPRRIIVFGLSTLAPQILDVLATVARWSQVIVCLQNPCRHYWGDMIDGHQFFPPPSPRHRPKRAGETPGLSGLTEHAHPLLAAWGRQGRDLMRMLDEFDESARFESRFTQNQLALDLFESPDETRPEPTLLSQIQTDILEARTPDELMTLGRRIDPGQDRSIRFHSAHSPLREIEILHDLMLAAFDADPGLHPTDLIVMVPDMNLYAPAITAIFGRLTHDDPRYIPFTISDQSPGAQTPILGTLEQLLHLDHARLGRSEILDLLGNPLLRARFDIADADVPTLQTWIDQAGIRWGLDAHHREQFGLPPAIEQNSWRFGLNRLLLGYLSGDTEAGWQGMEPYAGIDGSAAPILGGLADLILQLSRYTEALQGRHLPETWATLLRSLMDDFLIAPENLDAAGRHQRGGALTDHDWQMNLEWRGRLLTALNQWLRDCQSAGLSEPLTIDTVRTAWLERLEPHRLQQRFLVGGVHFATLMPMRTIPYRHLYLLGMDDASYPRRQPRSDFDLMANRYRPGDRSRREDDRYLFLEAVLAARERLTISWVGRDIHKNTRRPASVLVSQLADYIDQYWRIEGAEKPSTVLTTEHPLHPFSHRYFSGDDPNLFTYAADWQAIHNATRSTSPANVPTELPLWRPESPLNRDILGRFLRHPAHTLWRARFNTVLNAPEEMPADHEPFQLDALALWQVKFALNDALRRRLAKAEPDMPSPDIGRLSDWLRQELSRLQRAGTLPLVLTDPDTTLIEPLLEQWQSWLTLHARYARPQTGVAPIGISGPEGIELVDSPRDILLDETGEGARICFLNGRVHKGNTLDWHKLVAEWPAHLLSQMSGVPVFSHLVSETGIIRLAPVPPENAETLLVDILTAWFESAQQPFPLACKTAFAWLNAGAAEKGRNQAAQVFNGTHQQPGERDSDPLLARLWENFEEFSACRTRRDEDFTALAERLYGPLTAAIDRPAEA
ncbi:exodeoxyribonuclease V subunit gamma [Halothiobacillus diazotrophicus]|uniref:RecBCD enzyme subunit RecC n=1 Tax=Halothiobacillus diazotrophicus TaxID=1860122 RepID=A0A191ZJN5_9GAMM|nr:exodeoxyribonuclease V subunit gamma [Halothiobacillus diazotrophicus]ANJ68080.1 exodeoxyribonuclease V subunit gamma [Halothiobacillus diazotrophicus]